MSEGYHRHSASSSLWKMASGLEKLERLFSGSRRRERGRFKTKQQQRAPPVNVRRPSSPIFPSPSYLRPTSMQMTPRDAQVGGPGSDRGRSYSVPTMQEVLVKRSSAASSITVVAHQPSRSDAPTSSLRHENRNSQPTSQLVRFRFPEDSLFKNDQSARSSGEARRQYSSRDPSPRARAPEPPSEKRLLDWSPKPISFLFNPLDFKAFPNDRLRGSVRDGTESTLLPSPDFAPSALIPDNFGKFDDANPPSTAPPPLPQCNSVQKLTLSLRQQSLLPHSKPIIDSPPASDSEQDAPKLGIHRSSSLDGLSSPRPDTPMMPTHTFRRRRSVRETWGNRMDDPRLSYSSDGAGETITHSRPLRKTASTSTLSLLEYQLVGDNVLIEPTFDDFYALSDDDIAESLPLPATYDCRAPPTPPPKDLPRPFGKSHLPRSLASQNIVSKPPPGEITPPCTPTKSHLLALPYSPITPLDTFGALLAAELARKYDFAVLYVLSLWPVEGRSGSCQDDLLNILPTGAMSPNTTAATSSVTCSTRSRIAGRLLAAYGLNEVPSPFEIATETHLAALNCEHWNEYRNIDARPDDIWRGWIRAFSRDHAPTLVTTAASTSPIGYCPKDRGIVFAAYSKKGSNRAIPMSTSPEKELLLRQLYFDAKALVESLLEDPSKRRDAPKFFPDLPTPDNKASSHGVSS